ncbi:MAG: hypothetical protein J6P13_04810 [Kiritimatiellae bacterium]|nr:hypothetical protein [Kiritimatiellia bacterium]
MKNTFYIAVALGLSFSAYAEKQPLERYQSIIDRMPFGVPPPNFDPTKSPDEVSKSDYAAQAAQLTEEQQAIQKNVQFSVINQESDGTVRVGFSDKSEAGAPRHYYMAVGEEKNGWVVKAADPVDKTMTIEKDGVEVALSLGENSGGGDAKGDKGAAQTLPARAPAGANPRQNTLMSTRESRGGRRARREAEAAEESKRNAENFARNEAAREEMRQRMEEARLQHEAEKEEQRMQLQAIQEELKRAREERALQKAQEQEQSASVESEGAE